MWSPMHRLWTGQGPYAVLTCTNGVSPNHLPVIVASEFEGGLNLLHEADDDAAM